MEKPTKEVPDNPLGDSRAVVGLGRLNVLLDKEGAAEFLAACGVAYESCMEYGPGWLISLIFKKWPDLREVFGHIQVDHESKSQPSPPSKPSPEIAPSRVCSSCRFSKECKSEVQTMPERVWLECRKLPPSQDHDDAQWPSVSKDDWCGVYEHWTLNSHERAGGE